MRYLGYYDYLGRPVDAYTMPEDSTLRATQLKSAEGEVLVSTVFLGINHGYNRSDSAPVLWETMVFDQSESDLYEDEAMRRYTSAGEAILVHNKIIEDAVAAGALIKNDRVNPELFMFDLEKETK